MGTRGLSGLGSIPEPENQGWAVSLQQKEVPWPFQFVMQTVLVMDVSEKAVFTVNISNYGEVM